MEAFEVKSVQDLEKLSFDVSWQYFEKLVAYIFEENGFSVSLQKAMIRNIDEQNIWAIKKA